MGWSHAASERGPETGGGPTLIPPPPLTETRYFAYFENEEGEEGKGGAESSLFFFLLPPPPLSEAVRKEEGRGEKLLLFSSPRFLDFRGCFCWLAPSLLLLLRPSDRSSLSSYLPTEE